MVNTGRPSQGCERCRRLKTKCCENRPACIRCDRRGIPCVYRSEDTFRSMNNWSEKTVQTRVAKKLTHEMLHATDSVSCERQISLDWANASIGPFFDQYVVLPDHLNSTWGFLPDLPEIYARADPHGHLAQAVKACALSNMANASKMEYLGVAAHRMYGKALSTLRAAMNEPEEATRDGALITMMLLAIYEGISGTRIDEELFHAHHRGQASVLRLKSSDPTLSAMNASIFSHTNRRILLRDIAERRGVTCGLMDWPPGTHRSWLDEVTARFQVRIIEACALVNKLQQRDVSRRDEVWLADVISAKEQLVDIDGCILACITSCPPEWSRRTLSTDWESCPAIQDDYPSYALSNLYSVIACAGWSGAKVPPVTMPPPHAEPQKYRPRLDIFESRAVGHLWNFLLSSSLHLFRAMIDMSVLAQEARIDIRFPSVAAIRGRISDAVHDILASVPYLLGDLDMESDGQPVARSPDSRNCPSGHGLNVLFALHKVCALPGVDPSIREYVLEVFDRIGTTGHVRQALNFRDLYARIHSATKPPMQGNCLWDEVDS